MSSSVDEVRNDALGLDRVKDVAVSRRKVVGAGAVIGAGVAMGALSASGVLAQDATPAAQEEESAGAEFPTATPLGDAVPPEFTSSDTNWAAENLDLKGTRYVTSTGIDSTTVSTLGVAWSVPFTTSASFGALVSNPIIVDDVLFQQDAQSNVYAFNKDTGELLWEAEYNDAVPSGGPNGVGVGYGNIYFALGGSGIVVAASQETGEELWRTDIKGYRNEGITMAPLVYGSTVYISTIPGTPEAFYNGGQRGFIFALDASSGKILWYFDTTVDNLWNNARVNSGGGLWHVPSIDVEDGSLFVGIANAAPYPGTEEYPSATSRLGDNNYANALMKIDPDTASVDWFINVKPHDVFDLDNHLTPVLTNVSINGADTKVVISSGKHGIVVAANADTGEELWRTPVGKHQNDDLQEVPEGETVEVFPGTLGGVETSIAVADGIVFAPIVNMATVYSPSAIDAASLNFFTGTGQIVALDAATGEIIWDNELPTPAYAAATVANDVVFTAGLDGVVRGFKTDDGSSVFEWQAPAGINAPFAVSGDYLFVPAGGPFAIAPADGAAPAPTLVALKLGATGTIEGAASPAASAEASPAAAGGDSAFTVHAIDIAFQEKELTIPANTDVQVTVVNSGVLQHDLTIDELKVQTKTLNGGDSDTVTINAPAGTYEYYCSVPGHKEAGMVGTLTVE